MLRDSSAHITSLDLRPPDAAPFQSWDRSRIYAAQKCVLCENNPEVPFYRDLRSNHILIGSEITLSGQTNPNAYGFTIDLITGEPFSAVADVGLRIRVDFNQRDTFLSCKVNGYWQKPEEKPRGFFPFLQTEHFKLVIRFFDGRFKISVNGQEYAEYERKETSKITAIQILGELRVRHFRLENPLSVLPNESQILLNPEKYEGGSSVIRLPGNRFIWPGSQILINAATTKPGHRWYVTIQEGAVESASREVALQVQYNMLAGSVRLRSKSSGHWLNHRAHMVNISGSPDRIQPGTHFELIINCTTEEFQIALNGQHFASYTHQIAYTNCDYVILSGDCRPPTLVRYN